MHTTESPTAHDAGRPVTDEARAAMVARAEDIRARIVRHYEALTPEEMADLVGRCCEQMLDIGGQDGVFLAFRTCVALQVMP